MDGPLFFRFFFCARLKEQLIHYSLNFKWLELDHELWRVLGMTDNHREPFSLHANGAFVVRGQQILVHREPFTVYEPAALESRIALAASQAGERAMEVAAVVSDLSSYLQFIRQEHELYQQLKPGSLINIYPHELLCALLNKELRRANELALARMQAGDSGGFSVNGKSLYENALPFCRE